MNRPTATYRIQFSPAFGFRDAKEIVPYLAEIGITDLYASPIFKAEKGSLHGYDVVDPNAINSELGTRADLDRLSEALHGRQMGWIQDIVPNHMAYSYENQMLRDVLENGKASPYFHFFDIDWDHPDASLKGRLLAPFLGRFYGLSLEDGEIRLTYDSDGLSIGYSDRKFPLRIDSYVPVFSTNMAMFKARLGADHPDFIRFFGLLDGLKILFSSGESEKRPGQVRFVKGRLWELYSHHSEIRRFVDSNLRTFNGAPGKAESFNLLDDLLRRQLFHLAFWKVGAEEIDYRRFFNINGLISLRVEDEDVFDHTHRLVMELLERGLFSGLRVDHVDGLYDPAAYLRRLREKLPQAYLGVEKILAMDETLPGNWPVQGTTGYDFLNYVNGLFCDRANVKKLSMIYSNLTGSKHSYEHLLRETRRLIIRNDLAGDVANLAYRVRNISGRDRHGSDLTLCGLRSALTELLAGFPVYRTYTHQSTVSEKDAQVIRQAVERARADSPGLLHELAFLQRVLLLDFPGYLSDEERAHWLQFTMRFQQHTGALMAKGFEDTMLYVYNRLLSLNEVGSNPGRFGCSGAQFHAFNAKRCKTWPHALSATATHDTKRGEDVRARINVLSEIPTEWEKKVRSWRRLNKTKKKRVRGVPAPDGNDEYFLYQTLMGAWPFRDTEVPQFRERIKAYVIKAVREAKVHTAWLQPDREYEEACLSFVESILVPEESNVFLRELKPFQIKVAHYGVFNSLSQTLLKITAPGVPDFYQGTELWDLNLVDPDNRRPVDFGLRFRYLREIRRRIETDVLELIRELLAMKEDGRVKLFLLVQALNARKARADIFQKGAYKPLTVVGRFRKHLIAFARRDGSAWSVTVVPRFLTSVVEDGGLPIGPEVWQDTGVILPGPAPSLWCNVLTGQVLPGDRILWAGEIFQHFPVALLMSEPMRGQVKPEDKK
ncbi:MAG: malto-oligosyltrehalose synthase [Thermodesulfobacteriota bacterium]